MTHRFKSLKSRFVIATVSIVAISSFAFAFALLTIKNSLEEITFGNIVREQLQFVLSHIHEGSDPPLVQGWQFLRGAEIDSLPPELAELPVGSNHSIYSESRYYQIEVSIDNGERVMLLYDISDWEDQEHAVLLILGWGMLLVLGLALLLGAIGARPVLKPVRDLSKRLATIRPDERQQRIGAEFEGSEVGPIANEVDRYLDRLDEFVEREKFFTAAASHELRTPLSIMQGALEIIEAQQPDPVTQRATARMQRAADEMLGFIETTLFLAREEGQSANASNASRLGSIVREVVAELQPQFQARDITVRNHISDDPELHASPILVKMIVGNIVRNAMEHTREGEIAIHFEGEVLTVSDQGEGIASENLDKVYERNFSTKSGGTGMGLSLVKRLCDRLNWQIGIESTPGTGTTVKIQTN